MIALLTANNNNFRRYSRAIRFLRSDANPLIRWTARNYARSAYREIVSVVRWELRMNTYVSQDAHVDSFLTFIRIRESRIYYHRPPRGMCSDNFLRLTRRKIFMRGNYM